MKFHRLAAFMLFMTSLLFINLSCQKKADVEALQTSLEKTVTVVEAKAWFANDIVSAETKMLELPYTMLPKNAPIRLFARMGRMEKKLDWSKAHAYNRKDCQYLVVPLTYNLYPYDKKYQIARSIVFYKTETGKIRLNIV